MSQKTLLFIPMYNCAKQVIRVLEKIDEEALKYISEILIVNNRSTDNGEEVVLNFKKDHPEVPVKLYRNRENYGGGGSHKVAFNYAADNGFDYVIVLHGDDQGDIHDLLPHLESGEGYKYDSFLGARFDKGSKLVNYSKFRIFGNHVFNVFMTVMLGRKIKDLGSGLNMYSVKYLSSRFYMPFINSLTFYVYMLIYGVYSKSNFTFFPLTWREDDQISNAKFFKQSMEILKIVFRYTFSKKKTFGIENEYSTKEYLSDEITELND
ncbi:MAG: glycosyltransferase family 2 protein [Lachnospiraceae bacterium]|nr:glycosyltransferase family 2 protein [Lachnospiraceae bacterium]